MCLIPGGRVWYFICHYYRPASRATMYRMMTLRRLGTRPALGMLCLTLSLSLTEGCARSEPLHRNDTDPATAEQKLPFHPDTDQSADGDSASPTVSSDAKQAAALPFKAGSHTRVLPSGMLLTVQLSDSLSAATVRAGDAFTASVAAPLWLGQDMVVERGATVTGRVESAQLQATSSALPHSALPQDLRYTGAGYFRLTLNGLTVEGRQIGLQTSSLFARGTFQPPVGIAVQKGRRLTFRLTAPVTIDAPNSMANRQSVVLTSE